MIKYVVKKSIPNHNFNFKHTLDTIINIRREIKCSNHNDVTYWLSIIMLDHYYDES